MFMHLILTSWRATCSFGPMLIGAFLNAILYGVRTLLVWNTPLCAYCEVTGRRCTGSEAYLLWLQIFSCFTIYAVIHLLSNVQKVRYLFGLYYHHAHIVSSPTETLPGSDTSCVIRPRFKCWHLWPSSLGFISIYCRNNEHGFRYGDDVRATYH